MSSEENMARTKVRLRTWCGYDIPGMISLLDLQGAMRLDRSEDMSVHVSTCTSCDLNTLVPVVWKLWR
jgi:hypothetical protein